MSKNKRAKRVLSSIAASAMILGTIATPAMAASGDYYMVSTHTHYSAAQVRTDSSIKNVLRHANADDVLVDFSSHLLKYTTANTYIAQLMGQGETLPQISAALQVDNVATTTEDVSGYTNPSDTLTVQSVSAINAKQVQVTFNQAVDKDYATDMDNYYIQRASDASPVALSSLGSAPTAELQADNKTVIISAVNDIQTDWAVNADAPYQFIVKDVQDPSGNVVAKYTTTLVNSDKTAPTFVSATAKAATTTNQVVLTFSEPVNYATSGVFMVGDKVATPAAGTEPNQVVLTTAQYLTAGQSYALSITNLKDIAGNLASPNPIASTITVVKDSTATGVTSATVVGDDTVQIVFGEAMNDTSVTTASNIKLNDADGNSIAGVSVAVAAGDTTHTKYTLSLNPLTTDIFDNADTVNANLIFTSNVKDAIGNPITSTTKSVTFTKDVVAPTVNSVSVLAPTSKYDGVTYTNGALKVTLSEDITAPTSNQLALANISVVDQDGTDVTGDLYGADPIAAVVLDSKNPNILVIPFTAAPATTLKTATVRIAGDAVIDASVGQNGNVAKVVTGVDFSGATGATDTQKPVLATATGHTTAHVNTITYAITEANLDTATVINTDNYRLDGKPLPTGSFVTITGTAPNYTATINLPDGSIDTTRTDYAFTISNIADKSGNVADTLAVNNITLDDNVKPVLTAGKINDDGTVTLTFSEDVTAVAASDLVVKVDGVVLTAASATTGYTVAPITSGSDNGGVLLTFTGTSPVDPAAAGSIVISTIKTGTPTGADADGNVLSTNQSVTVK